MELNVILTLPVIVLSLVSLEVECSTYVLGNKLEFGNRTLTNAGKRSFLHQNSQIVIDGTLISFQLYTSNGNRVRLQAWRPASTTPSNTNYVLVGEKVYEPDNVKGIKVVDLKPYERFEVQRGDRLGFTNEDTEGPITYKFINSSNDNPLLSTKEYEAEFPEIMSSQVFDRLIYPYQFSLSATISTDKLPNEIPGPVGPPGSPGSPGKDINGFPVTGRQFDEQTCGLAFMNQTMVIGFIAWLIVLSFLSFITLMIFCCMHCGQPESKQEHDKRPFFNAADDSPSGSRYKGTKHKKNAQDGGVRKRPPGSYNHETLPIHMAGERVRDETLADYSISVIKDTPGPSNGVVFEQRLAGPDD